MKRHYTHVDRDGILWRFVGSRPVSQIADVMEECGLPAPPNDPDSASYLEAEKGPPKINE